MQSAVPLQIIGEDPSVRAALVDARQFATRPLPILLIGATGTGKEVFAQAIYRWSGRSGPLVALNCAGFPAELLESELFGHEKGAFTGAVAGRAGLIRAADGGMLFLDQLEILPLAAQTKLLRVLEDGMVRCVGAVDSSQVDLRVVCAAQPELFATARSGGFRKDLLYRLAGAVIELPELKRRGEDVVLLARAFAGELERELGPGVEHLLRAQEWPGNVRELRGVIQRAAYSSESRLLDFSAVGEALRVTQLIDGPPASGGVRSGFALSRAQLMELGSRYDWRIAQMRAAAGVSQATLYRWLKHAGLSAASLRSPAAS
ncbi:MAG TPA: sigma 54-interacting transcriptional regulator [Gemmatimonadales bacterium]|nr:sigma 54-interacting transcriptional regulator [Gemmatimonadales bacterium]